MGKTKEGRNIRGYMFQLLLLLLLFSSKLSLLKFLSFRAEGQSVDKMWKFCQISD